MSGGALFALAGVLIGGGLVLMAVKRGYDTSYMRKRWSYIKMNELIRVGAIFLAAGILGLAAWLAGPQPK
jgi:hypothetical protein